MNVLHEIAEIIGSDNAVKLGQSMGGACVYVPSNVAHDHPLTLVLGREAAQKLCDTYKGEKIDIPSKRLFRQVRDDVIRNEYQTMATCKGGRADTLALKYGLSRRQVLYIVKSKEAA